MLIVESGVNDLGLGVSCLLISPCLGPALGLSDSSPRLTLSSPRPVLRLLLLWLLLMVNVSLFLSCPRETCRAL